MTSCIVLTLLLVAWSAAGSSWAQTTTKGPLAPDGVIPIQTGSGHFSHVYEFCVTGPSTIVQHVSATITLTCLDDNRVLAENKTDYWEYWSFTKACCSKDQHATEVTQVVAQMQASARAMAIEVKCRCRRMDIVMTFDLYDGTAAPAAGAAVIPLEGGCGTFGIPAAPTGQQPTSSWKIRDGATSKSGPDAFEGQPAHTVTFVEASKKTVTHTATFYSGDCPGELSPAHPVPEGYR